MRSILLLTSFLLSFTWCKAQEPVYGTFKDSRVINTHSVEMLAKRKLDVRIGHRFGDAFGDAGGWQTLYGLETAQDVLIGAEYGATDYINVGLYRAKGAAELRQLVNTFLKVRLVQQEDQGAPFTLTALGIGTVSTAPKSENPGTITSFPKFAHRIAYAGQLLIARKFSEGFALQLIPSYVHRNLVRDEDVNGTFSMGLATRIQLSKVFGIIADATIPLNGPQNPFNGETDYQPILGIGLEIETGGHVFQVNFTNAKGIMETDYIPNTTSDWLAGQFRLGFTISRKFNL